MQIQISWDKFYVALRRIKEIDKSLVHSYLWYTREDKLIHTKYSEAHTKYSNEYIKNSKWYYFLKGWHFYYKI